MDKGNIYKKLHNVMQSVGSLEKDEHNDMQNYAYLSESAVKSAIQPLLVEQGIIFQVEVKKTRTRAIYKTKSGNDMYLTKAEIAYSFFDVEDGSSVSGVFEGHGTDTGDKGVYKAVTGAIKYILTSTFLIPTGDDPEKTNGNKKAPTKDAGASYAHTKSTPVNQESKPRPLSFEEQKKIKPENCAIGNHESLMPKVSKKGDSYISCDYCSYFKYSKDTSTA